MAAIALKIILAIICIAAIVLIMSQEGKQNGLGSLGGVSTPADSYWSQNKGRSSEGRIVKMTALFTAAVFIVCMILLVL